MHVRTGYRIVEVGTNARLHAISHQQWAITRVWQALERLILSRPKRDVLDSMSMPADLPGIATNRTNCLLQEHESEWASHRRSYYSSDFLLWLPLDALSFDGILQVQLLSCFVAHLLENAAFFKDTFPS